jgi:hypothetical protein
MPNLKKNFWLKIIFEKKDRTFWSSEAGFIQMQNSKREKNK